MIIWSIDRTETKQEFHFNKMESSLCHACLLISSITCILQLLQNQIVAHSLFHIHHPTGIPTNVTKHLYFPNFSTNNEIKLLGSAKISENQGSIQIPQPSPAMKLTNQAGRAIYSSPVRLFDPLTKTPASFQTTFSFQFKTIATAAATTGESVSSDQERGGNGLAFVIVPDEFTVGRPGPWLGIVNDACDHYKVFAVEFDNKNDPKFGDPNDNHVGINLGSVVSFKTANLSVTNVSLHDDSVHRAWIMYDGYKRWIDIYLGLDGYPLPAQPLLSSPLNLSPFLKEYMFVGFSASTGELTQIHNILSWNFSSSIKALLSIPPRHICHRNVAHQVSKYSIMGHHSHSPSSFTIFLCVVGLSTLALLSLYYSGKRYQTESSMAIIAFTEKKQRPVPPNKPRRFTISELFIATRRFSKLEILYSDSRGVLYRGTMPNGRHVAVKRFSTKTFNSSRLDWNRILKRISAITTIYDHPNLAAIRGWCYDDRATILVYDYFHNGTLDRWLFGLGVLSWARRFEVIKDIAETLSFLHSKQLFHGNLNTSSIFIDINYRAVLGDYGFIFLVGRSRSFIAKKKADVFMFGVLVLEIIAGKRKVENQNDTGEEEFDLLGFAWEMHERGETIKIIDERILESCINLDQAIRVIEIGLSCSLSEKNGRPSMEEVVQFLNMQSPTHRLPMNRPL